MEELGLETSKMHRPFLLSYKLQNKKQKERKEKKRRRRQRKRKLKGNVMDVDGYEDNDDNDSSGPYWNKLCNHSRRYSDKL